MAVSKQERWGLETAIFQLRSEGGLQKLREWLWSRREEINSKWVDQIDDDLTKLQGEARLVRQLLDLIDKGPKITKESV